MEESDRRQMERSLGDVIEKVYASQRFTFAPLVRMLYCVRLALFLYLAWVLLKKQAPPPTNTVLLAYCILEVFFLVEQLCCMLLCVLSPCFITGLICVVFCCPRTIGEINPEIEQAPAPL